MRGSVMAISLITRLLSCTLLCKHTEGGILSIHENDCRIHKEETGNGADLGKVVHQDGILHAMLS